MRCRISCAELATAIFLIGFSSSAGLTAAEPKAALETEASLYLRAGRSRILVKHLGPTQELQGNSITRDGNVFLAYSGCGDGAGTVLSIFDVSLKKERKIIEIGAPCESEFLYDERTDLVLFNWFDGIYVISMDILKGIRVDRDVFRQFEKLVVPVAKCQSCLEPVWTKDGKIAYRQYHMDGSSNTQLADVPPAALGRRDK
jgi:hypothetical protein